MNTLKRNKERILRNQSRNIMSSTTKIFIQKICYKKAASIDMTRFGFINDRKLHPVNLLLKPLQAQLEKICAKPSRDLSVQQKSPVKKKVRINLQAPQSNPRTAGNSRSSPRSPVSAQSSPGTQSPNTRPKKVILKAKPNSATTKKVRVIVPKDRTNKK